jgi:hypothetical protein
MTDKKQNTLDKVSAICDATDDALASYTGNDNIQLPVLVGMVAARMGWNTKQLRENDPIVRFYIRNHPDYAITKGPHGGVIPRAVWEKKQVVKNAKAAAKIEMQAKLDEMVLAANVVQPVEGKTFTSTDEEFEESSRIVRADNAAVSVMQQVADQDAALDARHASVVVNPNVVKFYNDMVVAANIVDDAQVAAEVDKGRKEFLDTMVEVGQKLLDEQANDAPVVENITDVFASIDDDDVVDEEFDELENEP